MISVAPTIPLISTVNIDSNVFALSEICNIVESLLNLRTKTAFSHPLSVMADEIIVRINYVNYSIYYEN